MQNVDPAQLAQADQGIAEYNEIVNDLLDLIRMAPNDLTQRASLATVILDLIPDKDHVDIICGVAMARLSELESSAKCP